ncbi:MAG: DUF1016 N-terminal domain-containing protein, partial [Prevotellaceae bacterium]|nr:DUF1016 N-terminal domain-containing protein [Prevotellaceae bacterium]
MDFKQLTQHIRQTHDALQAYAVKAINIGLTLRNWLIGCYIVEYEQNGEDRANYGEHLLENISTSLLTHGLKNVSTAELSRFRQFYVAYPQILGTLSQESLQLPEQILGTLFQEFEISFEQPMIAPIKLISNLSFSHFAELIKIEDKFKRSFVTTQVAYFIANHKSNKNSPCENLVFFVSSWYFSNHKGT